MRRGGVNVDRAQLLPGTGPVFRGERRAAQIGFYTAGPPAVAGRQRQIVGIRQGQRVVPPLAGNAVAAAHHLPVDDDPAADPGTEDDAEDIVGAGSGPVDRFGKGKAVGVVGQPDFALQNRLQVAAQRLADQAGGIGVLDQAAGLRFGARNADPDAAALPELLFAVFHKAGDRHHGRQVITMRGGDAPPQQRLARVVQRDDLDLASTEIDADPHYTWPA